MTDVYAVSDDRDTTGEVQQDLHRLQDGHVHPRG